MLEELHRTGKLARRAYAAHPEGTPILRLEGVTLRYESGAALEDISLEVHQGERLAIIGPNGAGKSTLFKIIAGVLQPTSGNVQVFGSQPEGHVCIAYLPQRAHVDWNYPVTVADVVMMGRVGQIGLFRRPRKRDWEKVYAALEMVNLRHLAKRQIRQLSGGQQQRMFIARALAQEAELLLMDEPLGGLDIASQEEVFTILDTLQAQKVTVLVALHDLKMAAERFDRVALLNRRLVHLGDAQAVFTAEHLMAAYGGHVHLLEAPERTLAVSDTCCDDEEEPV
ncbi:MAG: metal ABC transporter ATP-binding protein [Anaerolineae bacterium]|nr:MAG: metal ABC transporter ATP-binding protein [Anaerolineae bacterium]